MTRLLLATTNRGKAAEYQSLFEGLELELVMLDQVGISQEAPENYATFEENALSKAAFYAALSGHLTLADDSGLEVDALGGEPGVRSSRYAGDNATDADRVNFLLDKLEGIPWERRTARFKCVIAVAMPTGEIETVEGDCKGYICLQPRGVNGFGYDPVFFVPEYGKAIAELPSKVKNKISHRGRAAEKVIPLLSKLAATSPPDSKS